MNLAVRVLVLDSFHLYSFSQLGAMIKAFFLVAFSILGSIAVWAEVRLPLLISDGMILQRDIPLQFWGWASPGEGVTVRLLGKSFQTKADAKGHWRVQLPQQSHRKNPIDISIKGKNELIIRDVLFGDVWFCSGQSNMVHQMNIHDVRYAKEILEDEFDAIRQIIVPTKTDFNAPREDLGAQANQTGIWLKAVREDIRPFSAVAYFFAKRMFLQYGIPIGIIQASVGGTPIEAWMSEESLASFPSALEVVQRNQLSTQAPISTGTSGNVGSTIQDRGLLEAVKWYDPLYSAHAWKSIHVPGYWEDQGIRDLNGVVWYRKEFEVKKEMVGKTAKLFLGRIVDADQVYLNGKEVGNTGYQYPQRRYNLPNQVLQAGRNTLVVRVRNYSGKGGFVPDKPYYIFAGSDTVDLMGTWHYKVGAVFPIRPSETSPLNAQVQPTALFNGMVAPCLSYSIRGVLWYQGESNVGKAAEYARLLKSLIADWRMSWRNQILPFIFVQLPNYSDLSFYEGESAWAELREAQRTVSNIPFTGMAVAIDLGEWNDIHPDNKKDVGERLALQAAHLLYGSKAVYQGPTVMVARSLGDGKVKVQFKHTGTGLISKDGDPIRGFMIADEDRKFQWAEAQIQGDSIVLYSSSIRMPKYVRYAWSDNPDVNLYNVEGLPAIPFEVKVEDK